MSFHIQIASNLLLHYTNFFLPGTQDVSIIFSQQVEEIHHLALISIYIYEHLVSLLCA